MPYVVAPCASGGSKFSVKERPRGINLTRTNAVRFVLRLDLLSKFAVFLLRMHVYLGWLGVKGLLMNIIGR